MLSPLSHRNCPMVSSWINLQPMISLHQLHNWLRLRMRQLSAQRLCWELGEWNFELACVWLQLGSGWSCYEVFQDHSYMNTFRPVVKMLSHVCTTARFDITNINCVVMCIFSYLKFYTWWFCFVQSQLLEIMNERLFSTVHLIKYGLCMKVVLHLKLNININAPSSQCVVKEIV